MNNTFNPFSQTIESSNVDSKDCIAMPINHIVNNHFPLQSSIMRSGSNTDQELIRGQMSAQKPLKFTFANDYASRCHSLDYNFPSSQFSHFSIFSFPALSAKPILHTCEQQVSEQPRLIESIECMQEQTYVLEQMHVNYNIQASDGSWHFPSANGHEGENKVTACLKSYALSTTPPMSGPSPKQTWLVTDGYVDGCSVIFSVRGQFDHSVYSKELP